MWGRGRVGGTWDFLRVTRHVSFVTLFFCSATVMAETLAPDDAATHLTYASILFYKGKRLLQPASRAEGEAIFKEVEQELRRALELSAQDPDARRRQLIGSQSAHILGDLYLYVWKNPDKAKAFYEQAVHAYPEHVGAREALKRFTPPQ